MTNSLLTIDFSQWKEDLPLEDFIILNIYNSDNSLILDTLRKRFHPKHLTAVLKVMESKDYIKILQDSVVIREKALRLFSNEDEINFDEFWDVYPAKTPNGRLLRASNKTLIGKPTRDYTVCKKKYLSAVKTLAEHNQIVRIRIAKNRYQLLNDKNFENNLETYINQRKWEQDIDFLDKGNVDNFTDRL